VRAEIASSWGQRQTVGGPVLIVPFHVRYIDSYGKVHFLCVEAARLTIK
jgi:inner membrane protein involved in colicin E2 resistance